MSWSKLQEDITELIELQKYNEVLAAEEEYLRLAKNEPGCSKQPYAYALCQVGSAYKAVSKFTQAAARYEEALELYGAMPGRENACINILTNLQFIYQQSNNYTLQEAALLKLLDKLQGIKKDQTEDFALYLGKLSENLWNQERYDEARTRIIEEFELNKKLYQSEYPEQNLELADALGRIYFTSNNFQEAAKFYNYKKELLRKDATINPDNYFATFNELREIYQLMGDTIRQEKIMLQKLGEIEKFKGKQNVDIANTRNMLGDFYRSIDRNKEAARQFDMAMEFYIELNETKRVEYATLLHNKGLLCYSTGDLSGSEKLINEGMAIYLALGKKEEYNNSLSILGSIAVQLGSYARAETLYNEVYDYRMQHPGKSNLELASILNSLGFIYLPLDKLDEAEVVLQKSLIFRIKGLGERNLQVADVYHNLGVLYYLLGNYEDAETNYVRALSIREKVVGKKYYYFATALSGLGEVFRNQGKYVEAIQAQLESKLIFETLELTGQYDYYNVLNNLSVLFNATGDHSGSLKLQLQVLEFREKTFSKDHPKLGDSYTSIASDLVAEGNTKDAEEAMAKALAIYQKNYPEGHQVFTIFYSNYALIKEKTGKIEEAEKYFELCNKNILLQVRKNFDFLSEKERDKFLNSVTNYFQLYASFAKKYFKSKPYIISKLYDLLLTSKALLLKSTIQFKNAIMSSGNPGLVESFQSLLKIREKIAHAYDLSNFNTTSEPDIWKLEAEANILEKQLLRESSEIKQLQGPKVYSWKDIRDNLENAEAAVEIIRLQDHQQLGTNEIFYLILIVDRSTADNPNLVLIADGEDLETRYLNAYRDINRMNSRGMDKKSAYKSKTEQVNRLYDLIWQPIQSEIGDASKLYISPDGLYHFINLNTIQEPGGKYLLDLFHIRILTSTINIVKSTAPEKHLRTAALFGSPNFSTKMDITVKTENKIRAATKLRGLDITDLPGTKEEIKQIKNLLTDAHWVKAETYTAEDASELNLKAVKDVGVLHIATHGFFMEEAHYDKTRATSYAEPDQVRAINPLFRCGLLLAGAKHSIENSTVGAGILSGYEVSNMSLQSTELVVLSACETGLGKLQNGEGVFSLQRAFKLAGASSILMSLWKVNDTATKDLMIEFYKQWLPNLNKDGAKHEAFRAAQLIQKGKKDNPALWGAFVLVD